MPIKPKINVVQDNKPSRHEAEQAIETLLRYIGEDPTREGLLDTPKRVISAYDELFSGYHENPEHILSRTFEEVSGYDDMVLLKNMRVVSFCEHHMLPITGQAHVAYYPNEKVVGISKIARAIEVFAKRLQTQEIMTSQIAQVIDRVLQPKGVAVMIDAGHACMTLRGVEMPENTTITKQFTGIFRDDLTLQNQFFNLIKT